jgi:hypothetical protein
MVAVALAGREDHKSAALVAMAWIHLACQLYTALCLWRLHQASLIAGHVRIEP